MDLDSPLDNKTILIVEDRYLLADDLCRLFKKQGAKVLGPVAEVQAAEKLCHQASIDLAVLDIDLKGEMIFEVAALLEESGIPFVFATGMSRSTLPERWSNRPFVGKPVSARRLLAVTGELLGGRQRDREPPVTR